MLLSRMAQGDRVAEGQMYELIYDELHGCATHLMRRQGAGHTLQPTALLNECYVRLARNRSSQWENRRHFMGVAVKAMKCVLIDHARQQKTQSRGGAWRCVEIDLSLLGETHNAVDMIDFLDALERLAAVDASAAAVVELRVFAGLEMNESAEAAGVSVRTAERQWAAAKNWLRRALG
jgi:RNA polymerase sigma-70 factor (ECF subfamily)